MKWQSSEYPPDGTWCWLTEGINVWIAVRHRPSAGGWTNEDTWEDWEGRVKAWKPLETPDPPVEPSPDRYPMCADQPAQVDCRRATCQYHDVGDGCTNSSPAITLNEDSYHATCWSFKVREPHPEKAPEPHSSMCNKLSSYEGTFLLGERRCVCNEHLGSLVGSVQIHALYQGHMRCCFRIKDKPEPVCPVCGKPASEHRDGLWCCPHCAGEWRRASSGTFYSAHCRGCGHRTKKYKTVRLLAADVNRRA